VAGECKDSRCQGVNCAPGQICNPDTGQCQQDMCTLQCPLGERCVPKTGQCIPDPCATTQCQTCTQCTVTFDGTADCEHLPACTAPPTINFTGDGGGGLSCNVGGNRSPQASLWLAFLGLALFVRRARRGSQGGRR
jgi:hypothetical protein